MPSLANHQSTSLVKLLLVGDAMAGKTGSLVSLVKAGYKLRILDLDNKLDVLRQYVLKECPEHAEAVEYRTLRDKRKATQLGAVIEGTPKAFVETVKMLDKWKYGTGADEVDLGRPSDWGPDSILVIDSLSRLCDAAYDWQDALTPVGRSGEKDGRAVYGNAQDACENLLAMLTGAGMETNVIVIAHGMYYNLPDQSVKIFPQGVGQKLSPKIPQYFPNVVYYKNSGGKRTIQLKSDAMIDLANAAPFAMPDKALPVETGLADFFAVLREPPATKPAKPQSVTLVKKA